MVMSMRPPRLIIDYEYIRTAHTFNSTLTQGCKIVSNGSKAALIQLKIVFYFKARGNPDAKHV